MAGVLYIFLTAIFNSLLVNYRTVFPYSQLLKIHFVPFFGMCLPDSSFSFSLCADVCTLDWYIDQPCVGDEPHQPV
jgi:hypothetical protein